MGLQEHSYSSEGSGLLTRTGKERVDDIELCGRYCGCDLNVRSEEKSSGGGQLLQLGGWRRLPLGSEEVGSRFRVNENSSLVTLILRWVRKTVGPDLRAGGGTLKLRPDLGPGRTDLCVKGI